MRFVWAIASRASLLIWCRRLRLTVHHVPLNRIIGIEPAGVNPATLPTSPRAVSVGVIRATGDYRGAIQAARSSRLPQENGPRSARLRER
jgi:hypothetical protein